MKIKNTMFVLLLMTTQVQAYPEYRSDDCRGIPMFGKSSTTVDYQDRNYSRKFFTQSFLRRYYAPNDTAMGWFEEKWNSFSKMQGCIEAFEPCFLRPDNHMAAGLNNYTLNNSNIRLYAPGVRGVHWWKQPSGIVVKKESFVTAPRCPSYSEERAQYFDRI